MSEPVQFLPWDTEFFGFKIGRVLPTRLDAGRLAAILALSAREGYRCLYFQADPDDDDTARLAEQGGFHLADVRIVLEHPFDGRPAPAPRYPVSPDIRLAPPRPQDTPALESLAVEIGHTSRFCFDRRFPPDACPRLYRAWLHKAINNRQDAVMVAYLAGQPVGLIACGAEEDTGDIQLAGVRGDMRGQGVGTALVQGALDWFRAQGARRAEVVTQARNVPAQRLYQQMGFFTRRMTLYYHKWFDEERG
ncbi:MAG: GNAT family N-acetyltransferase [Anaerolineae bacterium]